MFLYRVPVVPVTTKCKMLLTGKLYKIKSKAVNGGAQQFLSFSIEK